MFVYFYWGVLSVRRIYTIQFFEFSSVISLSNVFNAYNVSHHSSHPDPIYTNILSSHFALTTVTNFNYLMHTLFSHLTNLSN